MAMTIPSWKFQTNHADRKGLRPVSTSLNTRLNIQKISRSPETDTSTMPQSRKNASPNRMPPRRKISVPTISLRKIIRRAAPAEAVRISAVAMIGAMTAATIAGRIPAATEAVAVSAGAVDVAVEGAPARLAAAICRRRNMLRRKGLKARTIRVVIRVAMSRVRKARIVARNLAASNRAAQRSEASIIAVLKHRGRAVPLRQRRTLMPQKDRSCFPVSRSRNIAANPSRLPALR